MHSGDRKNTQRLITCVSRNRLSCLPDLSQTRTVRADSDTSPLAVVSPVVSGWPQNFKESVHMAVFLSRCRNVTPARHYTTCRAGTLHSVPARIANVIRLCVAVNWLFLLPRIREIPSSNLDGVILTEIVLFFLRLSSLILIATRYGLDGPGIESSWGRDFPHPSRRTLGPPSLLYNGYRVFLGGEAAGAWL
jgi:hypothetical protein